MIASDFIASLALLISSGSFGYTMYANSQNTKNIIKKEQSNYLKFISRLINSIAFSSTKDIKQNTLDSLREELTFCACYESESSFQDFSMDLDDNVYMMCETQIENDFIDLKSKCINEVKSFNNK